MGYFCLNDYDCIAFDMDHTVLQYNLPELSKLIYRCLVEYLIKEKEYDSSLLSLDNFEKYQDLSVKGIIFDYIKGNFIKINREGYVLRCSHGLSQMSDVEIVAEYGLDRLWPSFSTLKKTISNGFGYATIENFYVMPSIPLASILVDNIDSKNNGRLQSYFYIWKDIAEAFGFNFYYTAFKARRALFIPELISHPEKYVKKCPPSVVEWIKNLRKTKLTLLITHTFANLAEHLMTYAIGVDWKDYFDYIIGYAKKPKFFQEIYKDYPFYTMNDSEEISDKEVKELQPHVFYLCGSSRRLEKEIQRYLCRNTPPKFVYFGDSITSDIYSPAFNTQWDTVVILEELEGEEALFSSCITDECEVMKKKRKTIAKDDKIIIASKQWGSFFCDRNKTFDDHNSGVEKRHRNVAKLNTFWGGMVEKYSKLAIPLLDYITDLSLDHKFVSFDDGQLGFYPYPPRSLNEEGEIISKE